MIRIIDAPVIRDHRGWVINPLRDAGVTGAPDAFHLVSVEPGAIRGNHTHPGSREWLVVCNGPAQISWRNTPDGAIESFIAGEKDPVLLEIDTGCPHAVRNISSGTIYLLSFREAGDTETIPVTVIE